MSELERTANALDRFMSGNGIDASQLSDYMDPSEVTKLRPASDYMRELLERMQTGQQHVGLRTPWYGLGDKVIFAPHELSVWTGYKGHAKTMVLSQCMCHGMRQGDKVLVISPEFRPPMIIERKLRQCSTRRDYSAEFVRQWAAWAHNRLWFYDHQGSVNHRYILAAIRYAIDKFGVTQVVVDSLMKMGIRTSADGYDDQKRFVDLLQGIAHDQGAHIHLVAHARKGSSDEQVPNLHDVKGTSEICDMAENVYVVWTNKRKLDEMQQGNYQKANEADVIFKVEAQRNREWRGTMSLFMLRDALQFGELPDIAAQVYLSDDYVEF